LRPLGWPRGHLLVRLPLGASIRVICLAVGLLLLLGGVAPVEGLLVLIAGMPVLPGIYRRAVIAWRLPSHDWPQLSLRVTAVDVATGELVVFDKASGVDLVDAVAASCAVPGVWPAVTIGNRRYIDGGVRTMTNADLAAASDRALVLAPLDEPTVHQQIAELARAELVQPDAASLAAFGTDPLDPATRTRRPRPGAQRRAEAARIASLWNV